VSVACVCNVRVSVTPACPLPFRHIGALKLESTVTTAAGKISDLEARLAIAQQDVLSLQQQLSTSQTDVNSLEQLVDEMTASLKAVSDIQVGARRVTSCAYQCSC